MPERTPPSNTQAEAALLGSILANNSAFDLCAGLQPEHFADPRHALIFQMCQRRIEAGRKVDGVTLKNALENTGALDDVGGVGYLTSLLSAMVAINNASDYARAIQDAFMRRGLVAAAQELMDRAYGADPDDGDGPATAAWGISAIENVAAAGGGLPGATMADAVAKALQQSEAAQRGDKAAMGLTTGIATLDEMWAGLYPGSLDIIGARPRTGKTSLAAQIARKVAGDLLQPGSGGGCVAFLSLEMPAEHLGLVNLASMTGIAADDIRRGRYDTQQAHALILAQRELAKLPIEIIDRPRIPLSEAIGELRVLKRRKGLRLAILDHRNLVGRDPDYQRASTLDWYSFVTRRLKEAAKILAVPIICLIQIGRGAEGRDDPRPRIGDLEYAGEQDADSILLLHRPELVDGVPPAQKPNETKETHGNRLSLWNAQRKAERGMAEIILAKRRFGQPGVCKLRFIGRTTTFADLPLDEVPAADLWAEPL